MRRPNQMGDVSLNSGCPVESEWLSFAADSIPVAERERYLSHVAGCALCAAELRSALRILSSEGTTEEEAMVAKLVTSQAGWQMRAASLQASPVSMRVTPSRLRWIAAIAASVLVIMAIFMWRRVHFDSDTATLLARAYTATRPFEYRLPDDGYGPIRQQRGSKTDFDRAAPLLSAEAEIRKRLSAYPEDPLALEWKGRTQLIEGDYSGAIETLTRAEDLESDNAQVLTDLGIAYALRADNENRNLDAGHALELCLRGLAIKPNDSLALFNLALIYEKLSLIDEALDTWRRVISVNPSFGWRREALSHIDELEKIQREKKKANNRVLHDPRQFLAGLSSTGALDPLQYYEIFWSEWLPQSISNLATYEAARTVARLIQTRFGDSSLNATLMGAKTPGATEPLKLLARAITQNRDGHTASTVTNARDAVRGLEGVGLYAASQRARVELAYALRWAGKYRECVDLTDRVLRETSASEIWLLGSAHLEHSSCLTALGQSGYARGEIERTYAALSRAGIWPVALRAMGFLTGIDGYTGNYGPIWDNARRGLQVYWATSASIYRAQNFEFDLETAASLAGWAHAAVALYDATARSAHIAGNYEMEAWDRYDLAGLLHENGDRVGELWQVQQANDLLRSLERAETGGPVLENLKSASLLRDAEAHLKSNDPRRSLEDLATLDAHNESLTLTEQMREAQTRGLALAATSNLIGAEHFLSIAITLNHSLSDVLPSWTDRMPVLDSAAPSYRTLAEIQIGQNQDAAALDTWRRFRSDSDGGAGLTITMALLPHGIFVWRSDQRGTSARWVRASIDTVFRTSERFREMIASPEADELEIHRLGAKLFDWLLRPELEGTSPGTVRVNADSWLGSIPLGALTDEEGSYALMKWAFVETYGPPKGRRNRVAPITPAAKAFVMAVPVAVSPGNSSLPFLTAAAPEADMVAAHFHDAVVMHSIDSRNVWDKVSRSELVHFVGHGWVNGGGGALILGIKPDGSSDFLTSRDLARHDWSQCRLVVLSACLTATGMERGAVDNQSLVQALLGADVEQVVASRWSIDSEATQILMAGFYNHLLSGASVPQALAHGAAELSALTVWKHPFYWAGFDVFGKG